MNKTCGDGVQRWQVFSFFVCLPFQFLFVWPVFLFSSFSKKRYLRYYSVMESLNFDQWFSNQKQIPEVSVLRNPRLLDIQGHLLSFGIFGPPKCALRRYDWMLRVCLLDTFVRYKTSRLQLPDCFFLVSLGIFLGSFVGGPGPRRSSLGKIRES